MKNDLEKGTVLSIDHQGDRILLYLTDDRWRYHVIADPEAGKTVVVGDVVEYEPMGVNFGWFVRRVTINDLATTEGKCDGQPRH